MDASSRHRYRLPLHELLTDAQDGRDFATRILHESQGGYDLRAAGDALAFTRPGRRSGRAEQSALRAARETLEAVQARQRELADEYERLAELRARIGKARSARSRVTQVELAIRHAAARSEHERARIALDAFDPRMGCMTGDEPGRLDTLRKRISVAAGRVEQAQSAIDRERLAMERALPGGPLPETVQSTLHHELNSLQRVGDRLESGSRVAQYQAEYDEARAALGVSAQDEEQLASIDLDGIGALDEFALETEQLRADGAVIDAELATLTEDIRRDDGADADVADDALLPCVTALEAWLAAPAPMSAGRRWLTIAAMALAAVATVATVVDMTLRGNGAATNWMVATAGVVLIVLAALILLNARDQAGGRAAHAATYLRHGGRAPTSWTVDAVQTLLTTLRRRVAGMQLAAARSERRAMLRARRDELAARAARLEARRSELVGRLGVAPSTGPAPLFWLAERVALWRAARQALAGAIAQEKSDRRILETHRAAIVEHLSACGFPPADGRTDTATLTGAVAALDEREKKFTAARLAHDSQHSEHAGAIRELQQCQADTRSILESLELGEDELHLLAEWQRMLPSRIDADELVRRTSAQLERAAADLQAAVGADDGLLRSPEWQLERLLEDATAEVATYDSLVAEVARVEARVDEARGGTAASHALAELTQYEQALADARERDTERAIGALLLDFLQRRTRDAQRPAVFHRARELFLRVTHGRWRLVLDDSADPTFRAIDTESDRGHALHELSSGTRVQLLLAVRLAFVELQEGDGPRLPLLMDETLGTSDDARAQAIIETILELAAASGRQLFYFTAQDDEAAKWQGVLQARGMAADLIDLAACRRLTAPVADFTPVPALPDRVLPSPDGLTHAEYGRALRVPAIARDADSMGGTHLWHLTEELELLHALLTLRVETWGALEALVEEGGSTLVPMLADSYPRLRAAARALGQAHHLARVGRPRPVDRQALAASNAITDTFMDAVSDLAASFNGNAERLIAHLESGKLKRFRSASVDQLREFLLDSGHLASEPPLMTEEIAVRTMAAVSDELRAGLITRQQLDRLVAALLPPSAPGGEELSMAHPGLADVALDSLRPASH